MSSSPDCPPIQTEASSRRDTVMYSMRAGEWPEARAQLLYLLDKPRAA